MDLQILMSDFERNGTMHFDNRKGGFLTLCCTSQFSAVLLEIVIVWGLLKLIIASVCFCRE